VDYLEGVLNYRRIEVRFAWWKPSTAISELCRGRGHKNLRYLRLKAQRMAVTKTEFVAFRKTA
jgi:hypothetical protein